MNKIMAIKPGEPGFDLVFYVLLTAGLLVVIAAFWLARRIDKSEARQHGDSKLKLTHVLIVVSVIAFLIALFLPSVARH